MMRLRRSVVLPDPVLSSLMGPEKRVLTYQSGAYRTKSSDERYYVVRLARCNIHPTGTREAKARAHGLIQRSEFSGLAIFKKVEKTLCRSRISSNSSRLIRPELTSLRTARQSAWRSFLPHFFRLPIALRVTLTQTGYWMKFGIEVTKLAEQIIKHSGRFLPTDCERNWSGFFLESKLSETD
jgi:hypothetical protein